MNKVLKQWVIILGVYFIFVSFLFYASYRFEKLENKNMEIISRNISE